MSTTVKDLREGPESCPSETELQAFVGGGGKGHAQGKLEAHFADCARCRIAIGDLVETSSPQWPRSMGVRTLAEGEVVAGRYTVGAQLGKGGMGEVYAAHDALLQEQVALKTLLFTTLDDPEAVRRMKAEVQLARRVTHPHVCRIMEFGLHQRSAGGALECIPYLTMELLHGETLAQCLRDRGALPWEEATVVFRHVISGLAAIHKAGIVHRDFKSDNVFLTRDEQGLVRAVITDFGLAKSRDDMRSRSSVAFARGTLAYMAPEQLEGKGAQAPADVYALGTVMFETLVGQLPFASEPGAAPDLWGRCRRRAPKVREHNHAVPAAWCNVIDQALHREPEKRFADARALLTAIERNKVPKLRGRVIALAAAGVAASVFVGFRLWPHSAPSRASLSPHFDANAVMLAPKASKTFELKEPVPRGAEPMAPAPQPSPAAEGEQEAAAPAKRKVRRRLSREAPATETPADGATVGPAVPGPVAVPVEEGPAGPDGLVNPFTRLRRTDPADPAHQGKK